MIAKLVISKQLMQELMHVHAEQESAMALWPKFSSWPKVPALNEV